MYDACVNVAKKCIASVRICIGLSTAAGVTAKERISCNFVLLTAVKLDLFQYEEEPELGHSPTITELDETANAEKPLTKEAPALKRVTKSASTGNFLDRLSSKKVRTRCSYI